MVLYKHKSIHHAVIGHMIVKQIIFHLLIMALCLVDFSKMLIYIPFDTSCITQDQTVYVFSNLTDLEMLSYPLMGRYNLHNRIVSMVAKL